MSGDSIRKSIRDYENMRESERTYTESEMRLERAAWQREAIAGFRNPDDLTDCADTWDWHTKDYERSVLAIPTDQSALDRHDAELQRNGCKCICHEEPEHMQLQDVLDGLKWSNNKIVKLKAQTAALLEKAAVQGHKAAFAFLGMEKTQRAYTWHDVEDALTKGTETVRALIPANHAAALADRVRQAVREECEAIGALSADLRNFGPYQQRLAIHRAAAGAPVPDWGRSKSQDKRLKAQGAPGAPEETKS